MYKKSSIHAAIAAACVLGAGVSAHAEQLEQIAIEAEPLPLLGGSRVIPAEGRGIAADGGELLRSIPGVSGSRLGGKGIDPAIRGQSQNRLNILIDGAYVHGGCPNRMDPPASFANIEAYDRITVLKGVQTLQYGGGGSGGTVLFERGEPTFDGDRRWQGKFSGSYAGNGDRHSLFLDVAGGSEDGYLRFQGTDASANNYEDGDGDKVRSAYDEQGVVFTGGTRLGANTRLKLSLEATRADDVYYAGRMDAPVDDNDTIRFELNHDNTVGPFSNISAELYKTDVDHIMDNYSLRTFTAPMYMQVKSDSVTEGYRIKADLEALGADWLIGLDYQDNNRDATRFASPRPAGPPANRTQSYMWPDVDLEQTGIFAEADWELDSVSMLKAGLRYDYVSSDADKASRVTTISPGGINTANGLYTRYYGVVADKETENNWGGLLRYERDFNSGTWFVGANRSVRTADATERFMAANAGPMAGAFPNRWVGNPDIDPEKHHQIEAGASWNRNGWNAGIVGWFDDVDDYILRDRAHGQKGILQTDNATIYRNVDAEIYGFEVEGDWEIAENWKLGANMAYVRARNTSDSRDIAQTPPLEMNVSLDYEQERWSAGALLRAAAKQTDAETDPTVDSGLDADETPGWGVLDVHGSYHFNKTAALDYGVENIFDKTYAYHLNQANAFDPTVVQVNEPGRNIWLKLNIRW